MEKYFEDLVKVSEEIGSGLTNDIYLTSKGTVVKRYSRYPLTSFLESLTNLVNFEFSYVSRSERMKNEIEMKRLIRELGFNTPKVIEVGEESIEFEKVPGTDGFIFLSNSSSQDAEKLGEKLGNFLNQLHSSGAAVKDFRLSNIHAEGPVQELHFIDHEYSRLEAGKLMRGFDQLTLFSSARQTGCFESFLKGFKRSDSDIVNAILFLSIFLFGYHALLIERDYGRFREGLSSIKLS